MIFFFSKETDGGNILFYCEVHSGLHQVLNINSISDRQCAYTDQQHACIIVEAICLFVNPN